MLQNWDELTRLTGSREFNVLRVRIRDVGVEIKGEFELPPLARLSYEDQVFVAQFIRCHGSIKEMEQVFGVSYPTIKARLNRLIDQLSLVQVQHPGPSTQNVLERLERGEISATEAAGLLNKG